MIKDEDFLKQAYAVARSARSHGNHPFGAIAVLDDRVVAKAENTVNTDKDPTGHAETNLMRKIGNMEMPRPDLERVVMYTSTEPCVMCCGATYWAGVRTIVYGFPETGLASLTGSDHPENPTLLMPCRKVYEGASVLPQFTIRGPMLEDEGRTVHGNFWETTKEG